MKEEERYPIFRKGIIGLGKNISKFSLVVHPPFTSIVANNEIIVLEIFWAFLKGVENKTILVPPRQRQALLLGNDSGIYTNDRIRQSRRVRHAERGVRGRGIHINIVIAVVNE